VAGSLLGLFLLKLRFELKYVLVWNRRLKEISGLVFGLVWVRALGRLLLGLPEG
jgi:hypothetical protein